MSFISYLQETEHRSQYPVTGDTLAFVINQELAIECDVVDYNTNSCLVEDDDQTMLDLQDRGHTFFGIDEAEYQGRKVKLNDPIRTSENPKKKFKVYVKDPKTGNVKVVRFGDPNLSIKRDDPARRKSFRARHGCDKPQAKDKTKARYWSCYQWRKGAKVDN